MLEGASSGVRYVMDMLISGRDSGIMVPIPQYPLYSALISLNGGSLVSYYLKSQNDRWVLDTSEIRKSLIAARNEGKKVKAIVIINPGNPTGQVLTYDNMVEICKFCEEEDLLIIADEVYQENIYSENKFISFRNIIKDLGMTN
jgi:alanine transaminase